MWFRFRAQSQCSAFLCFSAAMVVCLFTPFFSFFAFIFLFSVYFEVTYPLFFFDPSLPRFDWEFARGGHKKCDIARLFFLVCVPIFELSSAVEGYAAEMCDTFQSSHLFTVVLAVLIHLLDVVLQLSDFSWRGCEWERHKDRVRLLHEPSSSQLITTAWQGKKLFPGWWLNNLCCSKSKSCYRWEGNPFNLHLFIPQWHSFIYFKETYCAGAVIGIEGGCSRLVKRWCHWNRNDGFTIEAGQTVQQLADFNIQSVVTDIQLVDGLVHAS